MPDETLNTATTCDYRGVARRVPKGMLCPHCRALEGAAYRTLGSVQYRKCRACKGTYTTSNEANTLPRLVSGEP